MSNDEFNILIDDISKLSKDIHASLSLARSVKSKTMSFEFDLGFPLSLKEPLYHQSLNHSTDEMNDLENKIKDAIELGNVMMSCALLSLKIAKLYISSNISQETVRAMSELSEIYYNAGLYHQASMHSSDILKHITKLSQNYEMIQLKIKAYYMIARGNISEKKFERSMDFLKMGHTLSLTNNISCDRLYHRIKAELFDAQDLFLSAIESYQEVLSRKLYKDEHDHVNILLRMHRLYKSSGEEEKALLNLEKADKTNNDIKPRNMLMFLKLKLMLIIHFSKDQIHIALEIIAFTLNEVKGIELNKDEKKIEVLIRNHNVNLLMAEIQYDKALMEQKKLTDLVLQNYGPDSIKLTLNQIQQAKVLKSMGKLSGSITLLKKTIHNRRFREHLRHPIFETKLKSLFETFDISIQEKLVGDFRDLQVLQKKDTKCSHAIQQ